MAIEFDFTNFRDHPADPTYVVFMFRRFEQANFFEGLLKENELEYERFDETDALRGTRYLFATRRKDMKTLRGLNNLAIGKYRNKFIPDRWFRLFVIIIGLTALILAIAGYLVNG